MQSITKRAFSSIFNYSNAANPRVSISIAQGQNRIGDLVFELYQDKQPAAVDNFRTLINGNTEGQTYVGASLSKGFPGLGIYAGRLNEENFGAYGAYNVDGDTTIRHTKRGMLSFTREYQNCTGSEFQMTFAPAPWLDGYQTVFGELVEGHSVLDQLEQHCNRHGHVTEGITIAAAHIKE